MASDKDKITQLNRLLRAELSAVRTYRHLIEKVEIDTELSELKAIEEDHERAARILGQKLPNQSADTLDEPGPWQNVELIAESAGSPARDPFSLKALKEGETQNVVSYEQAIASGALGPETSKLVEEELLPRTKRHVSTLDKLLQAA